MNEEEFIEKVNTKVARLINDYDVEADVPLSDDGIVSYMEKGYGVNPIAFLITGFWTDYSEDDLDDL